MIQEWFKELLIDGIISNLSGTFDTVNTKVGEIAGEVGMTPAGWNGGIFNMIRGLSETVIVPIAGIILTFVMCYELIQLIVEKNNLHDFDTWLFWKWIFKTFCAVLIVTNTWNIVMAVFDVAQSVVNQSAGVIMLFGLTKRQLVCFGSAALVGVPLFFLSKGSMGTTPAALCMILVMLPFFLFALYEKNGQTPEALLGNLIQCKFIRPKKRVYQTNNAYSALEKQAELERTVGRIASGAGKRGKGWRRLTRQERKQIEAVIRQAKGDGKNHTVQASLPFRNMHPDGLCRLDDRHFSKTIAYADVSYRLAGPDDQRDIFSMYAVYMSTLGNRPDLFPSSGYVPKYVTNPPAKYEIPAEYLSDERFAALITEAEKYLGFPYVWGGSSPQTSFDCSGFVSYVLTSSGLCDTGRLGAQGLYNISTPVSEPRPGDLVFFVGTYDTPGVSHVGFYVGDGMLLHCGDPIQYTSLNTNYWQSHLYAYGRPPYN